MSSDILNNYRRILSENGYRLTKTREQTFLLLINSEPQSMKQIITRAKGKLDRVSVYRTIELFEKLGIVHRIYIGWKFKIELSEDFIAHHHHLSCLSCGSIIDIADEQHIDEFISTIAKSLNFKPRRHVFEIDGYCSKCA